MKAFFFFFFFSALPALANTSIFRMRLTEDLGTLDWNYGEVNNEVVLQLMEGLFSNDEKGRPVPALTASYKWGKGKRSLEVKLKAADWSDGKKICGSDFVDSWTRFQDKKFASPYAHYATPFASFSAPDCGTIKIEFNRATPEALALLAQPYFFPIRKDVIEKSAKIWNDGVGLPVTGPYRLEKWRTNQEVILVKNSKYHGPAPLTPELRFLFLGEESTAKVLYDKGDIDAMKELSPLLRTHELEKSAEFRIFPTWITYYFGLNAGKSRLLENLEVRAALGQSLRRERIGKILGRETEGQATWVHPSLFPGLKISKPIYVDWKKIRARLAEAVIEGRMDIVLRTYNKPAHKQIAEWAQGEWQEKLGVKIPIEVQEGKVYWRELSTSPPPVYFSGVTAPFAHPRAFLQEFLSTSTANWTSWKNAEYDAAVANDQTQKAEAILEREAFVIPLYQRNTVVLLKAGWKGFHVNPLGQIYLRTLKR